MEVVREYIDEGESGRSIDRPGFRQMIASAEERERLELLQVQIAEAGSRLEKLYDALETGQFGYAELAPRIRTLLAKREELAEAKAEAEQALGRRSLDMADLEAVRGYVEDLRDLLGSSPIVEQRGFLRSFVERIEVDDSQATMYYSVPVPPNASVEEVEALPFIHHG